MTAPKKVLRVLITHECSGVVREAFRALGYEAWSCDLVPAADGSPYHFQMDAGAAITSTKQWDFIGMHPVCTYLTGAGIHWNNRGRGWAQTEAAVSNVRWLMETTKGIPSYIENRVGIISTRIRKSNQTVQPYEFGDDASKRTCLWLSGLPALVKDPALRVAGRMVEWPRGSGKLVERWSNQADSGQNKLTPSPDRAARRAQTYPGLAKQMAAQWSEYLLSL